MKTMRLAPPNENRQAKPRQGAFTAVELLAIIAMLALWAAIFGQALARSQPQSRDLRCLNNFRQLGSAWKMYAEDNQGRLVPNRDGATAGKTQSTPSWVAGWLDYTSSPDNTNTAMLVNRAIYPYGAFLGPYIKAAYAFKCPADKSVFRLGSQVVPRVRSVSMNNQVGDNARSWNQGSPYQLYRKLSDIGKPTPAQLWVMLDEREDSINDGTFFTNPDTLYNLIDYPAGGHNQGAGFLFADGHSEIHRWRDPRTVPPLRPGQQPPLNVVLPNNADVTWLQQHATSKP